MKPRFLNAGPNGWKLFFFLGSFFCVEAEHEHPLRDSLVSLWKDCLGETFTSGKVVERIKGDSGLCFGDRARCSALTKNH
jgi:hypothetical protein